MQDQDSQFTVTPTEGSSKTKIIFEEQPSMRLGRQETLLLKKDCCFQLMSEEIHKPFKVKVTQCTALTSELDQATINQFKEAGYLVQSLSHGLNASLEKLKSEKQKLDTLSADELKLQTLFADELKLQTLFAQKKDLVTDTNQINQEVFEALNKTVQEQRTAVTRHQNEVKDLKQSEEDLKEDQIPGLEDEVAELKTKVAKLKAEVANLKKVQIPDFDHEKSLESTEKTLESTEASLEETKNSLFEAQQNLFAIQKEQQQIKDQFKQQLSTFKENQVELDKMKKNIDQKSQLEKMKKDIEKTQNDIEKTKNGIEKTKNEKCQENIKVLQDFLAQQNLLLEDAGLKLKQIGLSVPVQLNIQYDQSDWKECRNKEITLSDLYLKTKNPGLHIIGREKDCADLFLGGIYLSRRHCTISYDYSKGWILKDTEPSHRGTWIQKSSRVEQISTEETA